MRYLAALFGTLVLAACSTAPISRNESQTANPTQVPAGAPQKASVDPVVVEFLLTSAATDFHTQSQVDSFRFRNVRLGHVMTSSGAEQYMLCGEFLLGQKGDKEWMPFATLKTSGYEQWNGAQAAGFCQRPSVIWDKEGDLSSSLQSRLDSLRKGTGPLPGNR